MDAIITRSQQLNLMLLRRQITCPECDSYDLRPVRYGLGTEGGCVISSASPKLRCNCCGMSFLSDPEIAEHFEGSMQPDFEEQYLIDEVLLNTGTPTSDYTKTMALQFIRDEKNLAHLRLVLDDKYQPVLTSQISKVLKE